MSVKLHFIIFSLLSIFLLGGLSGCKPQQASDDRVLRVGIIASLSGLARPWGLATVRCAQVTADYYNESGGFEVEGKKVRIELIVRDDAFDASIATSIAHDFSIEGVNYVIGPLGDASVSAASRELDGAETFYVHYGFQQTALNSNSLGVLGMPLPGQSLPLLFSHLRNEQDVRSVLIVAYDSKAGIQQKGIAEHLAADAKLSLIELSRFDVSEETFDSELNPAEIRTRVERIVALSPDALVLTGCPPGVFVALVDYLRSGGYRGYICAQNFQDPSLLAKLGAVADGVYDVVGEAEGDLRSEYYQEIKARYLDISEEWSAEADTKLYALEFILASIQEAGLVALADTSSMHRALQKVRFEDPFYQEPRMIPVIGGVEEGMPRQIQTPIRISKMLDGRAILVKETASLLD